MALRKGPLLENLIGILLRAGVLISAAVVLIGAAIYLYKHGSDPFSFHKFVGEPTDLRHVSGIFDIAWALSGRGIIQLGILILIATPVSRVIFCVVAFAAERDWTYVALTLIVLGVLAFSLLHSGF